MIILLYYDHYITFYALTQTASEDMDCFESNYVLFGIFENMDVCTHI